MAVSMMMTPFMALRRALRRLPSLRPALAAGAGVSPRFAGLATILEKCASRCQAATPPAARAVLLTPGGPRVLWTAAGVQLQRRAAAQARPSTSRRRARAAARGAAASCAGTCGALLVWSIGDARLLQSRRPRAARPLAGGRGRSALPGRGRQGALRHGRSQGGAGVCFATVYPLRLLVRGSPAAPPGWPARRSCRRRAGSILG